MWIITFENVDRVYVVAFPGHFRPSKAEALEAARTQGVPEGGYQVTFAFVPAATTDYVQI